MSATISVLSLAVLLAVATGSAPYRRGGRGSVGMPLPNDHPILSELYIIERNDLQDRPDGVGWWVDVLPDAHPPPGGEVNWIGKPWALQNRDAWTGPVKSSAAGQ